MEEAVEVAQSIYSSKAEQVVAAQLPEEVVPNLLALRVEVVVAVLEEVALELLQ